MTTQFHVSLDSKLMSHVVRVLATDKDPISQRLADEIMAQCLEEHRQNKQLELILN